MEDGILSSLLSRLDEVQEELKKYQAVTDNAKHLYWLTLNSLKTIQNDIISLQDKLEIRKKTVNSSKKNGGK